MTFCLIACFGFLFNMDKVLTSEINVASHVEFYNDYPEFPLRNTFKGIFDPEQRNPLYFSVFSLNILMNDFVLVFLLMIFDLLLIVRYINIHRPILWGV
ncbi:hypothetical protein BpHYR1_022680 [Brachionus plicatilis]|uniref:Uncharacterized protein n=1 Tax=Brachionus plicatilis TaxID=10195 RepID=A0A3M7SJN2_BRAPC|nr:hypothetical protein BpHYR1_022680 [Brachionus plicatilis]